MREVLVAVAVEYIQYVHGGSACSELPLEYIDLGAGSAEGLMTCIALVQSSLSCQIHTS